MWVKRSFLCCYDDAVSHDDEGGDENEMVSDDDEYEDNDESDELIKLYEDGDQWLFWSDWVLWLPECK